MTQVSDTPRARTEAPPEPAPAHPPRRNLRAIRMLWYREVVRLGRNRTRIVMGLVTPLMFLLILGTGLESAAGQVGEGLRQYRSYLFPGVLVMATQAPAIAVGISVVWDRQAGFLRQALVAPVHRVSLLLGLCLGGAMSGALYGGLVLLIAGPVGVPYHPALLIALVEVSLVALMFTALGILAAVCIRKIETFQVVVSLCLMPLMFLSGAMFPPGGLPGWLGTAVQLNPLTYAIDAIRRTLPGDLDMGGYAVGPQLWGWTPPVLVELAMVVALAFGALLVAARRFSRAE
ncbi:ABC-2 type transport system permease protein [Herbihabitans rhizosphaerae]|uniref:Transport permease protein n=1 Tax=Herbihabitans rhizosphaerae TaxID=1872711 RepID=A0A4Q7KFJ4_9PSEU|nr:ABC transporter permease [Herbihabitans rhizosphaerae]RZS33982.1 ABC-2 type transport system permease protein [Herbihabitans rhizosphaerae]